MRRAWLMDAETADGAAIVVAAARCRFSSQLGHGS